MQNTFQMFCNANFGLSCKNGETVLVLFPYLRGGGTILTFFFIFLLYFEDRPMRELVFELYT